MSCKIKITKVNNIIEEIGGGAVSAMDCPWLDDEELPVKFVSQAPHDSLATSDKLTNLIIQGRSWADPHQSEELTDTIIALSGIPDDWFENPNPKEDLKNDLRPLLDDLKPALNRILKAAKGKKMMIYGDFDTDGITSTRILWDTLQKNAGKKTEIIPYLPFRSDNHGVSSRNVEEIAEIDPAVMVFVDCASNDTTLFDYAKQHPEKTILILDHHDIDKIERPENVQLINSNQYQNLLSGAGLAFCAAWALEGDEVFNSEALGYATIGTIGDMVALNDKPNFHLSRLGLDYLNRTQPEWALKLVGEKGNFQFDGHSIAFNIVNRLNSLNRTNSDGLIGVAALAGQEESIKEIRSLDNLRRKEIKNIMGSINDYLSEHPKQLEKPVLIVNAEEIGVDIGSGYAGLVANKLIGEHKKPVMVASNKDESGNQQMSVRSVDGIDFSDDIYSRLSDTGLVANGGGHSGAGGFSFNAEKFAKLRRKLDKIQLPEAQENTSKVMRIPLKTSLAALHSAALATAATEPHGMNNPEPRFVLNAAIIGISPVGKYNQGTQFWLQSDPQEEPTRVTCMRSYEKTKLMMDEIKSSSLQNAQLTVRANYTEKAEWPADVLIENIKIGEFDLV